MKGKFKVKAADIPKLSARPDVDVRRMLERAKKDGRRPSRLINDGLRKLLIQLGYARKKDLTEPLRRK